MTAAHLDICVCKHSRADHFNKQGDVTFCKHPECTPMHSWKSKCPRFTWAYTKEEDE